MSLSVRMQNVREHSPCAVVWNRNHSEDGNRTAPAKSVLDGKTSPVLWHKWRMCSRQVFADCCSYSTEAPVLFRKFICWICIRSYLYDEAINRGPPRTTNGDQSYDPDNLATKAKRRWIQSKTAGARFWLRTGPGTSNLLPPCRVHIPAQPRGRAAAARWCAVLGRGCPSCGLPLFQGFSVTSRDHGFRAFLAVRWRLPKLGCNLRFFSCRLVALPAAEWFGFSPVSTHGSLVVGARYEEKCTLVTRARSGIWKDGFLLGSGATFHLWEVSWVECYRRITGWEQKRPKTVYIIQSNSDYMERTSFPNSKHSGRSGELKWKDLTLRFTQPSSEQFINQKKGPHHWESRV
jgi:hypothetical protein